MSSLGGFFSTDGEKRRHLMEDSDIFYSARNLNNFLSTILEKNNKTFFFSGFFIYFEVCAEIKLNECIYFLSEIMRNFNLITFYNMQRQTKLSVYLKYIAYLLIA